MNTISITYELLYQFKDNPIYQVTKCKKVFNTRTGKQIKKAYKNGSVGYWLVLNNKKTFVKKGDKNLLEHIPKINLPF